MPSGSASTMVMASVVVIWLVARYGYGAHGGLAL
jgi:hypothetical protein